MRADAAVADRRREVRAAARSWRRAGAIDDVTLKAVEAAYPDDRARLGPVFRIVAFVFALLALNAFFGVIALAGGGRTGFGVACLMFATLFLIATELLVGPLKRADSGIETATALSALTYALVAFGFLFERAFPDRIFVAVLLALAVVLASLGSVRWGSPLLAVVAGVFALFFLARLPAGRVLWMAAAAIATPLLLRGSESSAFPPAHRQSFRLNLVLALCAFYAAVHLGSWDSRLLEWLAEFRDDRVASLPWVRPLSILATALVPAVVLAFGVGSRRAYLMNLGVLLGVVSLVTLRFYVHVAPVWVVLVASGTAALLVVLAVRRLLAGGPERERGGFTAEPLFDDATRRHATEIVGTMMTLAPGARTVADQARVAPGGGRYGGGGATSDY